MNLKEAFRCVNKIDNLMNEVTKILERDSNIMKTESTYLRSKVDPSAEDSTFTEPSYSEFADNINDLVDFQMRLLSEREKIFAAIRTAKASLDIDFDSEASLNTTRRHVAECFRHMISLRNSEVIQSNTGHGYRFNSDGNQVVYKCDLKKVTTINFNRNTVREYLNALSKRSENISTQMDTALIASHVNYAPPFDLNDTFHVIFMEYLDNPKKAESTQMNGGM